MSTIPKLKKSKKTKIKIPIPTHFDFIKKESRILLDRFGLLLKSFTLLKLPKGQGEPVLVIPGLKTNDLSTLVLRKFLKHLGYKVQGWGLGTNHGHILPLKKAIETKVKKLCQENKKPIRLIGWSLGGYLAREVARDLPKFVHSVISMGSPLIGGSKYTLVASTYKKRGLDLDAEEIRIAERNKIPIKVPLLVLYSKGDGVVAWQACLDENKKNKVKIVEVKGSHFGMGFNAEIFEAIAAFLKSN